MDILYPTYHYHPLSVYPDTRNYHLTQSIPCVHHYGSVGPSSVGNHHNRRLKPTRSQAQSTQPTVLGDLQVFERDGSMWVICVFNSRHRMPFKSLEGHIKSCPDNPSNKKDDCKAEEEMKVNPDNWGVCSYNKDHRMPKDFIEKHQKRCPDRPKKCVDRKYKVPSPLSTSPVHHGCTKFASKKKSSGSVLVFDLETDSLTSDFPGLTREEFLYRTNMTVGVAFFEDSFHYFTTSPSDLVRLEEMMDNAGTIVIQNHTFDLGVLEKYYPHRTDRLASWHCKVFDFYDVCRSLFGCPYPLESLAEFNKEIPPKLGEAKDAPTLWREGKLAELFVYCQRDVEILWQLYKKRTHLRIPVRKDTATKKIVGVITLNFLNGVVPSSHGRVKRSKKVKDLINAPTLPPKCPICMMYNKHKHPKSVSFESDNEDEDDTSSTDSNIRYYGRDDCNQNEDEETFIYDYYSTETPVVGSY